LHSELRRSGNLRKKVKKKEDTMVAVQPAVPEPQSSGHALQPIERLLLLTERPQLVSEIVGMGLGRQRTVLSTQRFLQPTPLLERRLRGARHTLAIVDARTNPSLAHLALRAVAALMPEALRVALVWPWSDAQTGLVPAADRLLFYPLRKAELLQAVGQRPKAPEPDLARSA
jgi:hypothetical protein